MRKVIGDTLAVSVVSFVNRTKSLIFIPFIVSAVALEGYGAFVQIFLTARLVSNLTSLELAIGFQRLASKLTAADRDELGEHVSSVLVPMLGLSLLGATALFAAAPTVSDLVFDGGYLDSLRFACVVVVSNAAFSGVRQLLRAQRRFKEESALSGMYEMLPYVAFVVGAAANESVLAGVKGYVAADVTIAALALVLGLRGQPWRRISLKRTRIYFTYSLPISLSLAQGGLLQRGDLYFLSYFMGLEAMATYNVVYRAAGLIQIVARPIQVQLMSYVSRSWDSGHQGQSRQLIRDILLIFFGISAGLVVCIASYIEPFWSIVLRQSPPPGLWLVAGLVGLGLLANTLRSFFYLLIRLQHSTRDEVWFQLMGLIVNVGCNLLLIPRLGLVGAAIATVLSYAFLLPGLSRRYPLGADLAFVAHIASFGAISLVALVPRLILPPSDFVSLAVSTGLAFAAYLGATAIFKRRLLLSLKERFDIWTQRAKTTPSGA